MATPRLLDKIKVITTNINTTTELANAALPKKGGSISGNLTVSGDLIADLVGNASTASKLSSAGKITLTGDASGNVSFDGTAASLMVTVNDDSHNHSISNIDELEFILSSKSPIASPVFTGTPTAPTATAGTNTTQIATTEFVATAIGNKTSISGNAGTATKLAASKTIAISGGATGTATSFDGSKNITIPVTALDISKVNAGVLPVENGGTGSSTKNFVDLSSIQTIGGTKTFNAGIYSPYLELMGTATTNGGYIDFHYGQSTADYTSRIIESSSGTLTVVGNLTATAVYNAVWNDYAEFFPRGEETEAGDFVALSLDSDNEVYVKASKETSKSVGIHSDSFGHLIGGEQAPEGQDFVEYNLPKYIPVGLVGRVRANIVGEVKKGDFIVISDIPGVGRAFNKEIDSYVDIIGMACESSTNKDIKRIKVKLGN